MVQFAHIYGGFSASVEDLGLLHCEAENEVIFEMHLEPHQSSV